MKKNLKQKESIGVCQGDVSLHIISELPANLKPVKHNGIFKLAESEITGHIHRLKTKVKEDLEILQDAQGNYYLEVKQPIEIEHYDTIGRKQAEHDTLTIEPATYIVRHERNFNPFEQEIKRVSD